MYIESSRQTIQWYLMLSVLAIQTNEINNLENKAIFIGLIRTVTLDDTNLEAMFVFSSCTKLYVRQFNFCCLLESTVYMS